MHNCIQYNIYVNKHSIARMNFKSYIKHYFCCLIGINTFKGKLNTFNKSHSTITHYSHLAVTITSIHTNYKYYITTRIKMKLYNIITNCGSNQQRVTGQTADTA